LVPVIGHIYIYGEVGKQVTLDTVLKEITPKATSYEVHIHSPGGEVFEGYAIYNALKNTGKNITVKVEGVCASIATLIAAAGHRIVMNQKAQWMIHNPSVQVGGEAKDLRNAAAQLDRIKSQLIDSWVGRTKLSREQLSEMYDNETWLTPEQALEMGFVDEVQEVLKAAASANLSKYYDMEKNQVVEEIKSLGKLISGFFKSAKNLTETLEDGRVIVVPDGDDWTGQPVTTEDGAALEDGTFTLAGGKTITVAGGVITEVMEPEDKKEEEKPEDMNEVSKKLEAAEARIKELESALTAQTEAKTQAEAKARKFEAKLNTELKQVQDKLKAIETATVGDATPPKKAEMPTNISKDTPVVNDPLQAWFKTNILDKRNTD
jgi:ATP-dependent protease ClpP protease subunit